MENFPQKFSPCRALLLNNVVIFEELIVEKLHLLRTIVKYSNFLYVEIKLLYFEKFVNNFLYFSLSKQNRNK